MKVSLESTSRIVQLDGVEARVWEGHTEAGVPIHAFITRIAVEKEHDTSQFQAELQEHREPTVAWPARMLL
jgi:hypothetical protein